MNEYGPYTSIDQLTRSLDAGVAYEMVGFLYREEFGGEEKQTLD